MHRKRSRQIHTKLRRGTPGERNGEYGRGNTCVLYVYILYNQNVFLLHNYEIENFKKIFIFVASIFSAMVHTTEITPVLYSTFIYWAHYTIPFKSLFDTEPLASFAGFLFVCLFVFDHATQHTGS